MDTLITVDDIKKEIEDEVEVPVIWRQEDINGEDPLADVKEEEIEGVVIPNLVPKVEADLIQSSTLLHDCPLKSEPNLLEELEVIKDLVPFQDIKPNYLPKEDGDLSNHDCQIESDGDIKDEGIVHDLVPKIKTETPSSAVKRELRICLKRLSVADLVVKVKPSCTVEPLMETDNKEMDTLITVDDIKKEIEDEVEVPVIWRQEDINGEDPLADVKAEEIEGVVIPNLVPKVEADLIQSSTLLHDCPLKSEPNLLEELEVIKDLVPFQDIKPNYLPKEDGDLSNHDCQIESDGDIKDEGIVHDLVPKIKTETPSSAVKRELRICLKEIEGVVIPNLVPKVEADLIQSSTLLHDCPLKSEPNLLEELEVIKDLVPFQDIKPNYLPKEDGDLSNHDCQIESDGDIKDEGIVHDLVPKIKTETPSSAVKRELRICLKDSEGVQGSDPLNEPLKVRESGTRQVGRHRKSKMSADSNISSSTINVLTKTTYTCEMCNICFNSQVRYKKHFLNHSESELLSCAHCSYKTLYKDKLISHMNKHLGVKKQYRCKYCSYKCHRFDCLTTHIRTHTGEKPYVCKVCPKKFSQSGSLKTHMRTHSGEKPYVCKVCSFKCSYLSILNLHVMRIHSGEKPFACKVCSYKCFASGDLKTHMRTHSGEKPYACKVCSYKGLTSSSVKRHMLIHTGEKSFACKVCSSKFKVSGSLKTHMRTHSGEKPYVCKVCSFKCSYLSILNLHVMRIHLGEKPFACKVCSYKFFASGDLKTHMRTHSGEKPYACNVCSYKGSTNSNLKIHMRTHTGEKPFACKVCSYKGSTCGNLKPFACKVCSYKGSSCGNLKTHILRTHTGEKPYVCKVCSYKCSRSNSLKTHMLTHTRKKN